MAAKPHGCPISVFDTPQGVRNVIRSTTPLLNSWRWQYCQRPGLPGTIPHLPEVPVRQPKDAKDPATRLALMAASFELFSTCAMTTVLPRSFAVTCTARPPDRCRCGPCRARPFHQVRPHRLLTVARLAQRVVGDRRQCRELAIGRQGARFAPLLDLEVRQREVRHIHLLQREAIEPLARQAGEAGEAIAASSLDARASRHFRSHAAIASVDCLSLLLKRSVGA